MKVLLILLMLSSSALAQTSWPIIYYDTDTGNDNNSGTKQSPVKTIEKARSLLKGSGQIISPVGVTTITGPDNYKPKVN